MQFTQQFSILSCFTLSVLLTACGGGNATTKDAANTTNSSNNSSSASNANNTNCNPTSPATTSNNSISNPANDPRNSYAVFDASSKLCVQVHKEVVFDLSSGHTVTKNDAWHIGYQKYRGFAVNGGVSGAGDVKGCIAKSYQKKLFTKAGIPIKKEFEKLTPESTLADFNRVNKWACMPHEFKEDTLNSLIKRDHWLKLTFSGITPIPAFSAKKADTNGWLVRSAKADGNGLYQYAKVKVAQVNFAIFGKKEVVFKSKRYDHNSQSFASEWTNSPALNFKGRRAYWDLDSNTEVTGNDDWELSVNDYGRVSPLSHERIWSIQVNSSVSGPGDAALGVLQKPLEDVTNPTDTSQVYKYFVDKAKGALSAPGDFGPFQYGVYGLHKMTPNFTVYLIKDGDKTYKVQFLGNYGQDGKAASGHIYLRYAELN